MPRWVTVEIQTALPVTEIVMDLGVTGTTQSHQIATLMCSAFRNRQDVVNLLHRSQPTFLSTLLTQRVLRHIAVADTFPSPTVLFVDIG